ncbi:hypothetical protein RHOER0001_4606 [Rhodococcus erythropolis SK121]|nr:hypothetical protein RHOER0001_4606 [Rhodococcus erythropolis SK121]
MTAGGVVVVAALVLSGVVETVSSEFEAVPHATTMVAQATASPPRVTVVSDRFIC